MYEARFKDRFSYIIHNLWCMMGTTAFVAAHEYDSTHELSHDQARDKDFSNMIGEILYDAEWSNFSRSAFEEAWKHFRADSRGVGRGALHAWYRETDAVYLGFMRRGNDNFDPDSPYTFPEESGYQQDPPFWLRVKLPCKELCQFAMIYTTFFWS